MKISLYRWMLLLAFITFGVATVFASSSTGSITIEPDPDYMSQGERPFSNGEDLCPLMVYKVTVTGQAVPATDIGIVTSLSVGNVVFGIENGQYDPATYGSSLQGQTNTQKFIYSLQNFSYTFQPGITRVWILGQATRVGDITFAYALMTTITAYTTGPLKTNFGTQYLYHWIASGRIHQDLNDVSTRGMVKNGQNFIVGFVVNRGNPFRKILIRGVGPALVNFGVPSALKDPVVTVYNAAGQVVATNDNWDWQNKQILSAFASTGAFGLTDGTKGSNDSVILMGLPDGNYTALIKSADASQTDEGDALLEVYPVPY